MHMQLLSVALEKLREQALNGMVVDIGVRVEEFERDVYKTLPRG